MAFNATGETRSGDRGQDGCVRSGASGRTIGDVLAPPSDGRDWLALSFEPLPVADATAWTVLPECGGVVTFVGTVRDHAPGRGGVTGLSYEAYEEHAVAKLADVAAEVRRRHPGVGRLVIVHRLGDLELTDAAVVVVASAPHRDEAFAAARLAIDATKATVPIWKKERWAEGEAWGTGAEDLRSPTEVGATR
jgi:molybdopterin synthase catalytic subunit